MSQPTTATPAQESLRVLNEGIAGMGPLIQQEVDGLTGIMQKLVEKYDVCAELAIIRVSLEISVKKGQ